MKMAAFAFAPSFIVVVMTIKRGRRTTLLLLGCVVCLWYSYRSGAQSLMLIQNFSWEEEGSPLTGMTASSVEVSTTSSSSTTTSTESNWTTGGLVTEQLFSGEESSSVIANATSRIRPDKTKSSPVDDASKTRSTGEKEFNKTVVVTPETGLLPASTISPGNATVLTCMLEQQNALMSLQRKWRHHQRGVPILRSIVASDNQTLRFSFTVIHLATVDYFDWALDANWTCDGKPVRTKDSYTKNHSSPQEGVVVVECPITAENLSTTLVKQGKPISQTYFTKHFPCATQSARVFPQPKQSPTSCTMISGNRRRLTEWIEYHRLIGFQRFVVYVNEPWGSSKPAEPLPQAADITYIPWPSSDDVPGQYPKAAQIGAMMDCIFRAQVQQIPWVAIHDVDEYIQVTTDNETLGGILQQSEQEIELGGLHLPSWFFGSNGTETMVSDPNNTLLMDYVWRSKECYANWYSNSSHSHRRGREKLILQPQNVIHFALHHIPEGGYMKEEERLRLNHYKVRHDGLPFGRHSKDSVVHDDIMVNKYGPILRERLKALEKG